MIGPQLLEPPIYTRLSCVANYPLSWFKGKFKFCGLIQMESCKDLLLPKQLKNTLNDLYFFFHLICFLTFYIVKNQKDIY